MYCTYCFMAFAVCLLYPAYLCMRAKIHAQHYLQQHCSILWNCNAFDQAYGGNYRLTRFLPACLSHLLAVKSHLAENRSKGNTQP